VECKKEEKRGEEVKETEWGESGAGKGGRKSRGGNSSPILVLDLVG